MDPLKSVLWNGGELALWEVCRLYHFNGEHRLTGTVVGHLEGDFLELRYDITCSHAWHTKQVELELRRDSGTLIRSFHVEPGGRWIEAGKELADVRGLLDIDLGISPSTNTLPIRRLDLPVGSSADVTAAWVKFPSLQIIRLDQRYTHVADGRYAYESAGGEFRAEIEIDEFGLVKKYGNYWTAIAV